MPNYTASLTLDLKGNFLKELKTIKSSIKKLKIEIGSVNVGTSVMNDKMRQGSQQLNKTGRAVRSTTRRFGGLRRAVIGVGSLIGGAYMVRSVATLTQSWHKGLAKVSTLTEGGLLEVRAKYGKHFKRLAVMSGQSVATVLEGGYQALSAGVKESNLVPFMKIAAKTAVSGFTKVNVAVDGLTSVTNAWGISAKDAARVFLLTQNLGKTTVGEIAGSIGSVGAQAKHLNISFAEVGASIAAVTSFGRTGSEAITGFQSVITAINKPTRKQAKAFHALGLNIDSDTVRVKGFRGTMLMLDAALKKSGKSLGKQDKLLSAIFGRKEAVSFFQTFVAPKGLEKSAELMDMNRKKVDVLNGNFKKMEKTMAFKRAKVRLQNLAITIGQRLAPGMETFAKWASRGIERLDKWVQSNPQLLTDLKLLGKSFLKVGLSIGKTLLPVIAQLGKILGPIITSAANFLSKNPTLIKALIGAAVAGKLMGGLTSGMGGRGPGGGAGAGNVVSAGMFAVGTGIAMVSSLDSLQSHNKKAANDTRNYQDWMRQNSARKALAMTNRGQIGKAQQFILGQTQFQTDRGEVLGILQEFKKGTLTYRQAQEKLQTVAPTSIEHIRKAFQKGVIDRGAAVAAIRNILGKKDDLFTQGSDTLAFKLQRDAQANQLLGGPQLGTGPLAIASQVSGVANIAQNLKQNFANPLAESAKKVANTFLNLFGLGKKAESSVKKGGGGGGVVFAGKQTRLSGKVNQTNNIKPITTLNLNISLNNEVDVNRVPAIVDKAATDLQANSVKRAKRLQGL